MFLNIALQPQRDAKSKGNSSLLECLGAVQNALNAIPDNVVPAPRTLTEAFTLIDPVLSMLHKQLREARATMAKLSAFGHDPMIEALAFQITAIELAYTERVNALRKKREDAKRQKAAAYEAAKPQQYTPADFSYKPRERKNKNLAFVWMLLIDQQMEQDRKKKAALKAA